MFSHGSIEPCFAQFTIIAVLTISNFYSFSCLTDIFFMIYRIFDAINKQAVSPNPSYSVSGADISRLTSIYNKGLLS